MSKKASEKVEEEWEDVPEGDEAAEEDEDTSINNSDVVVKYKKAAMWCNEVLAELIKAAVPGAKVGDLCKLGDTLIAQKLSSMFKGTEKGVSFPTCVSVGPCVCHNSPAESDDQTAYNQVLALNDVVRFDFGIHVDGYPAVVAHTIQLTASKDNAELAPDTKEANVITAAFAALNVALRQFRPECTLYDVTSTIEKVAALYGVNVVDGVLSHQMKRYIIDGSRCVVGKDIPEHKVHNYNFEPASVWTLDVVFSTGKGKLKEREQKASIFKVSLDSSYSTKLNAAQELQKEIDAKFATFPFAIRNCENKKARLGLSEMIRHNVVAPYPALFEKEDDAVIAQFKVTLFVTNTKIERLTGLPAQKATAIPLEKEADLLAISKLPMTFVQKEKKVKA